MRNKKAVKLGWLQFEIFRALHEMRRDGKMSIMKSHALYDRLYHGAKNPAGRQSIPVMCANMNRKLKHLGLKVKGTNRNRHSFYQLVVL
jgi:hypothetical protein